MGWAELAAQCAQMSDAGGFATLELTNGGAFAKAAEVCLVLLLLVRSCKASLDRFAATVTGVQEV